MDIPHYGGNHFLILIKYGPTCFAVWRLIAGQDSSSIIHQLSSIFFWLQLQWAYLQSDNNIAEKSYRSIKKIAAKKQCTISEATYWYNITSKNGTSLATVPANVIYRYWVKKKGIYNVQTPENEERCGPYTGGDPVWIKPLSSQCTTKFKLEQVTGVVSHHSVIINGVPCHIKI